MTNPRAGPGGASRHGDFWAQRNVSLLRADQFFAVLETVSGCMGCFIGARDGRTSARKIGGSVAPAVACNLLLAYLLVTRPREQLARQRPALLMAAWAPRLWAYWASCGIWDFDGMAVPGNPRATMTRLLLTGPSSIALIAVGQRLPVWPSGIVVQATGAAVMAGRWSELIVPVLERSAPALAVRVCEAVESAVQLLLTVATSGGPIVTHPPKAVCATEAARLVLLFNSWAVGAVLPLALVLALEVRAKRHWRPQRRPRDSNASDGDLASGGSQLAQMPVLEAAFFVTALLGILSVIWLAVCMWVHHAPTTMWVGAGR